MPAACSLAMASWQTWVDGLFVDEKLLTIRLTVVKGPGKLRTLFLRSSKEIPTFTDCQDVLRLHDWKQSIEDKPLWRGYKNDVGKCTLSIIGFTLHQNAQVYTCIKQWVMPASWAPVCTVHFLWVSAMEHAFQYKMLLVYHVTNQWHWWHHLVINE